MTPTHILGISAFYHDSAACLLRDGEIVAAAQEERFTRRKGDASFPENAVRYCLEAGGIEARDLDRVGFYDKPVLKFDRILESYMGVAPHGVRSFAMAGPLWIKEKLFMDRTIRESLGFDGAVLYAEHHESHAASAFFPSPFREAAVLTLDGVGEWATASLGVGVDNDIRILEELRWPDSLGLLYSAFTHYLGFKVNSGEYKVMGLAPYGEPRYRKLILDQVMNLREDGSFALDQRYFNYLTGLTMTSRRFEELFGAPRREPESDLAQHHMDVAASIQSVCEEVMLRMAHHAHRATGMKHLCLAGGVALNCVGNGRILREGPFEDLWIQPAAGDAGGALGVACLIHHRHDGRDRSVEPGKDRMKGARLGPEFGEDQVEKFLQRQGASHERLEREDLLQRTARLLAEGRVVGWFNWPMEFGPRALGSRSILGDPRDPGMQRRMNLKIKFRESFRPFAPTVREERVHEYFELDRPSPYMLLVAPVREERRVPVREEEEPAGLDRVHQRRSDIPAVTHLDHSARVQTVSREENPDYYDLLRAFEELTGCAVLVNTSFNVRGEPIVCTPEDAYRCFMRTRMDHLVMGPFLLSKAGQPEPQEEEQWQEAIPLD